MRALIATSDRDFEHSKIGREEYLRQIDGLSWGEDPREGYFDGTRFVHPASAFQLVLPPDWKTRNSKQAVAAVSPNQDAVVYLTLAASRNLEEAANKFSSQEGVSTGHFSRGEFDGLSAMWSEFNAYSGQTLIKGRIAFVSYDGRIYRLTGYTSSAQWASRRKAIDGSIQSFARLRDRNELTVQPRRISIVQIERGMTLQEFYRAYPSSVPLETVALMNDAQPGTRFSEGDFLKRVVGGK